MTSPEPLELTEEQKALIVEFAKRLLNGDAEAIAYADSIGITIV